MIEDPRGQWAHPGKNTRIPGNQITMEGVDYPVWAVPDVGEPVLMQPGQNYTFPGASYVDEYPMLEQGGQLPIAKKGGEYETKELTDAEIEEYVKGGYIVEEELPKAQTGLGKLVKYFKPKPITIPKPSVTPTIKYNPKDMNYVDVHNSLRRVQTNNKLKFDVLKKGRYDGLFPSTYAKRRDGINEIKSLINERTSFDENFKITHDNLTNDYVKKVTERNRIKDRKEAVERMEIDKIVGSNPSPDQLEFIKKYPSYSTWLYKNNKGDLIGDYKNAFDSNIVDDAIKQQSTFVRGVKNAPNEEVAKQWLTSIGDVKAKDRRLLNLGDAVYGSNAIGIMESFGRGDDVSGNFGGLLELDLGLDGLPPIEKIEGFEKAIRQASDMVSIPGYPNISIGDAAALNKNEELRNLGIKAIDSVYTTHSSERGVIDDAIIKIDKLIDLSNIGTTKPLGSGGMWGYINGEAIKADEELFHHVNNIPNLHTAWSSKEAKDKWMSKWRKIHMKLSTIHDDLYNQMRNAKGKLDDVSVYKDHNKEEIAILTENLLQMQKELKGKLQKTIGQTGLGIGIGLFGVGLYNAEPTERSKKRRLERYSQRKNKNRKLVNNKPSTKNTNSPLPKNMLGGELSQDQYNDTPEFDGDLPEIVNSKEHGVDTPVYVQVEEKESPIHGTGVFSKEPISKGQSIGVSHIRKEFEKNGKMYQAPFPSKQIGGYNHSEEPNVTEVDNGDHISLIAIRDIQPGEELVSNYDDSEIQDMERSSDFIRKNNPKAQDGYIVKQRRGVRNNPDGSESTHLMNAEYVDGRGWVGFPSLFQDSKPYANDQENWKEISRENGWWPIYQEALKRGEVYDFGEDKEAALAFGRGSWKDQLPEHLQDKQKGGFQLELTPEEIDKYVKGGYVVEELPKANGGKTIKALAETNKYFKKILTGDEIEKLKGVYSYINENNANIINRLPQLRKANDLIKLWASDKNQIALKKGTGMIYPGLEIDQYDKSKLFFTPYRDKSSRQYMDLEFDSEELLKKLYEQQDLIKLGESYLNNYHKIGNKYPIIKIPIETNYGKDFTFRTNKQGFVESPLPHFYHGVGHPSDDFNLENLEFDRNKIDVNKLKGWTDTGKKHRRVDGDGEYGLFGSMNLNTWRDPALKYSSRDRAIFDLVKDPSKRPDDFGILKKIYLSPNAKFVSVNTPYVKEALKDINYSNSYRDRLKVSGRNKGMTPQKAAKLKSKWDIDGIIDTEWGELAVFNPDAITGVSDTKFKLFDYIDPITGLLNQNIHTAQKINNKLINNYSANFITPHRNMLSSVKSKYDGIPNYYNFGLNSEKVYVPQSLLSNKLVDMPVPSGSTFQPFSKEWWEAAKPNIDLIRKQGGELPKARLGKISKTLKKTLPLATKFDDIVINSHPFFKTNVLKNPLLQQEMLKHLATGTGPIKNYTGDMLYELRSPEGKKRLLKQESEYLEYIGYPKNFIEKQAELNYKARLQELEIMGDIRNSASVASKFLDQNRLPEKGFFDLDLYTGSYYTHPDKKYSDVWTGDINKHDFFNLDNTQLGEKALPGFIRMGADFTSPFNIPILGHEIRGHGLQRGRKLQIDRDALKVIKPKKELNENQQKAYDYFKKTGKEPSAYLNELREAMLLKGLIKHRYENITPEKLQVASTFFKKNPMGIVKSNNSKSYLSNTRILDFMEESPEMYQNLSWLLNRLPTLGLGLGAAEAVEATLEEKKLGGELPKAQVGKWVKYLKPVNTYNKIVTGNSILPYALKLENSIIPRSTDYIKKLYTDKQIELLDKYGKGMQNLSPEDWESLVEFTKSGATDFSKGDFPISRLMGYYDISKKAEENAIKNLKLFETFTFPEEKNIRTWSAGIPTTSKFERTGVDTRLVIPSKYTKKLGDHFAGMPYTDKRSSFIWEDKPPQSNYYINKYGRKIGWSFNKNAIKEKELIGALPNNSFTLIGKTKANGLNNLIIKPNFKKGGQLPKANGGKWIKYLKPPNSITTSKKFLFTPPEELLRTEAAWNMMRQNRYYSLGDGPAKVAGLRDFKKQLTSKHNHAKFVNKVKQFDKAIDRVTYDKRLSEFAKEARIDELVKAQMEVQKKLFNIQDEYSKFRLDYSGLPITQARGKYGDQLGGGQGKLFNNLLNDKEYIKFGSFLGDENDMQNLINAGKKFNSPYAEAAFPTEAFRIGKDRFVQFMPKLDYSSGLSVDSDVIYNTVKELNELGVGLDYMGLDNIGSVRNKLGLVDLSYIGKPGERNNVFNINSDVFLPDVTNNKLGSKELVREIREMLVPGTGVKGRWKEGGSVELGDVVDETTMERLKAQGYTFEEI